jgi:exonuclease III
MKIATYNVNSIGARLPVLLHWLASSNPDVACLQELKAPDEKFPVEASPPPKASARRTGSRPRCRSRH